MSKPRRNDPCPCGSGTKHKKCCGSPKALPAARECGSCTACCTALGIPTLKKEAHEPCPHADKGCGIYSKRPRECRAYKCEWLYGCLHDEERPDKLGIVVDDGVKPGFRVQWGEDAVTVRELRPNARDEEAAHSVIDRYYQSGAVIFIVPSKGKLSRTFLCADPDKQAKAQVLVDRQHRDG